MLISELAKEVHENAVAHGWWDDDLQPPEVIALIHSEWSEALEEARAGRPLVYKLCFVCSEGPCYLMPDNNAPGRWIDTKCVTQDMARTCQAKDVDWDSAKPEGMAVELIDGCIRILDYMGKLEVTIQDNGSDVITDIEGLYTDDISNKAEHPAAHLVAYLHLLTSEALSDAYQNKLIGDVNPMKLLIAMSMALSWVKLRGLDPLAILLEKHAYNKTRPYKHGKKF